MIPKFGCTLQTTRIREGHAAHTNLSLPMRNFVWEATGSLVS